MNIIIKVTPEEAKQILKDLPGGPELWERLGNVFITTWQKEGEKMTENLLDIEKEVIK